MAGGFQLSRLPLGLDVLHPLSDRRILARFGRLGDPCGHRIQIDVGTNGEKGPVVENRNALKASLEKSTPDLFLPIHKARQRLFQALHEPTDALQSPTNRRHPLSGH
jgi:hypothetical protein